MTASDATDRSGFCGEAPEYYLISVTGYRILYTDLPDIYRMKRLLYCLVLMLSAAVSVHAQTTFVAFLLTSEEQLSNYASSRGYANFTLSADHKHLDYQVVFWSIQDPTAAHLHVGARGVEGPSVKDLQIVQGRYARGTWSASDEDQPLTDEFVDSLMTGKLYVNVHTLLNPSGEIRGQIYQPQTFVALASGAFETPAVSPSGNGVCVVAVNPLDSVAFIRGAAFGMSTKIVAAHIHQAPVGTPGGVVKPTPMILSSLDSLAGETMLNWTPNDSSDPMTPALFQALRTGGLYWNVHTELHQGGEIRGQLRKGMLSDDDSGLWFMAIMSGPQEGEVGRASNGTGTAFLHLSSDGTLARIGGIYSDLDAPPIGAHIHHGSIGEVPPNNIIIGLPTSLVAVWTANDAEHPLTSEDIDSLFAGSYYINVHTSAHPDGEIRGQLIPLSSRSELKMRVPRIKPSTVGVSVYPNPSATNVRLQIEGLELTDRRVRVVNSLGADVTSLQADGNSTSFNTRDLADGLYSFILETKSGAVSVPFTVLH